MLAILYSLISIASLLIYIAIVVVLFCWPPKPGRVLLVFGFSLRALAALYFTIQPLLFRYIFDNNSLYAEDAWNYTQYISLFFSFLNFIGLILVLLGFVAFLLDFKKSSTAGAKVVQAELVGGVVPHRSSMLLGLGFSGLFFWPVAILVRYLAAKDLASMKKDLMDPTGAGNTKIAYVLGSIGSVLLIGVSLTLLMIFIVLQFEMV